MPSPKLHMRPTPPFLGGWTGSTPGCSETQLLAQVVEIVIIRIGQRFGHVNALAAVDAKLRGAVNHAFAERRQSHHDLDGRTRDEAGLKSELLIDDAQHPSRVRVYHDDAAVVFAQRLDGCLPNYRILAIADVARIGIGGCTPWAVTVAPGGGRSLRRAGGGAQCRGAGRCRGRRTTNWSKAEAERNEQDQKISHVQNQKSSQAAVQPPSIVCADPLTNSASSEHRYRTM